jgi:hypothetical protein
MKKYHNNMIPVLMAMILVVSTPFLTWGAATVSLVTNVSVGKEIRNDYTGFVGLKIKVGGKDLQVMELGRYFENSNTQSHELQIVDHKTNQVLGSVTVDLSKGKADGLGFKYAPLNKPVTLKANMEYDIMSKENMNGDKWFGKTNGNMARLGVTPVGQITSQIYGTKPPFAVAGRAINQTFGPLNFKYQPLSK